uniref:Uncharacterized protein n=1 Tax=Arundo donax TaxID=35708 RepID=A0A0A8Y812_ARUDO
MQRNISIVGCLKKCVLHVSSIFVMILASQYSFR